MCVCVCVCVNMTNFSEMPNFSLPFPFNSFNDIELPFRKCKIHYSTIIFFFGHLHAEDPWERGGIKMANFSEMPTFGPIFPIQFFNGIKLPFRKCKKNYSINILIFGLLYTEDP